METKLKTIDAETLQAMPMGNTMFIVESLIPQGVNVLSGASKIGKSWLMLWLGLLVARGLIGNGLEEQITDFLTENPNTRLIIIDTLQKVRDTKGGARKAERLPGERRTSEMNEISHLCGSE